AGHRHERIANAGDVRPDDHGRALALRRVDEEPVHPPAGHVEADSRLTPPARLRLGAAERGQRGGRRRCPERRELAAVDAAAPAPAPGYLSHTGKLVLVAHDSPPSLPSRKRG